MSYPAFTADNTEGYSADDLAALNDAYVSICAAAGLPWNSDDLGTASLLDHVCETLLFQYDAGRRDIDLVTDAVRQLRLELSQHWEG